MKCLKFLIILFNHFRLVMRITLILFYKLDFPIFFKIMHARLSWHSILTEMVRHNRTVLLR